MLKQDFLIGQIYWTVNSIYYQGPDNSDHLPLDAPGGASYMKLRPFLTRSSPINNLEDRKQCDVVNFIEPFSSTFTCEFKGCLQKMATAFNMYLSVN